MSRVSTPKRKRLFGVGSAVRLGNPKVSILTLYTLSTLDRRKKTEGYGLVPVQGFQGIAVCTPYTLAARANLNHPCARRMG